MHLSSLIISLVPFVIVIVSKFNQLENRIDELENRIDELEGNLCDEDE